MVSKFCTEQPPVQTICRVYQLHQQHADCLHLKDKLRVPGSRSLSFFLSVFLSVPGSLSGIMHQTL